MGTYNHEKALEQAKKRRARVLKLFQAGKRVQDIAVILGVTKQRASFMLAKARTEA